MLTINGTICTVLLFCMTSVKVLRENPSWSNDRETNRFDDCDTAVLGKLCFCVVVRGGRYFPLPSEFERYEANSSAATNETETRARHGLRDDNGKSNRNR